MSTKYLGEQFDIHGGGMDLKFPHHECEIAQSKIAAGGVEPVKYWLHTNMLTVNGQKMSKSLGNSFLPNELFTGKHELLEKGYSPMTVRFFMLQTHYSSTLDFSNEALKAAEKGYTKLVNGIVSLGKLEYSSGTIDSNLDETINKQLDSLYYGMNDDFNTAKTIASLFNITKQINKFYLGQQELSAISEETFNRLKTEYNSFIFDVLGLKAENNANFDELLNVILKEYKVLKEEKNYEKVDEIRTA
jgi:Cysteinyl-tRNA synthetase